MHNSPNLPGTVLSYTSNTTKMDGFTLDSNTVKDGAEPAVAVHAAGQFQHKMGQLDQDRCESTCDSAYLSECTYSSVSDRLQDLRIDGQSETQVSSTSGRIQLSDFKDSVESRTDNVNARPQKRTAEDALTEEVYLTTDAYDQDEEGDT